MPLLLSELLRIRHLALELVADGAGRDVEITAAHVTELTEPGPWLHGGELLMTVGLVLPMTATACTAFVRSAQDGGAAALAIGLGPELPHAKPPRPLVQAARRRDMPLLAVPAHVPFIAVTKAVFGELAARDQAALQRSLALQRELARSVAAERGLGAVTRIWQQRTGTHLVILDRAGRQLAASTRSPGATVDRAQDLLDLVEREGVHGTARSGSDVDQIEVQPIGTRHLHGFAIITGAPIDPVATAALTTLLALDFERRHLADEPARRQRAAHVDALLSSRAQPTARAAARSAGLTGTEFVVVCIAAGEDGHDLAADLSLVLPGALVRATDGRVDAIVEPAPGLRDVLARLAPGLPTGISRPVRPEALPRALPHALTAMQASRTAGHPVQQGPDSLQDLLFATADPATLDAFREVVLGDLQTADLSGELIDTLAAWLATQGSTEATARRLGVHRHTVTNRLDRITRLTAGRLSTPDGLLEYQLALRIRDLAVSPPGAG